MKHRLHKHKNKIVVARHNYDAPIPDLFDGELMTCALCGKQQQSNPDIESNWRALQLDDDLFYVCTDHFPPDATATKEDFSDAYFEIITQLIAKRGRT